MGKNRGGKKIKPPGGNLKEFHKVGRGGKGEFFLVVLVVLQFCFGMFNFVAKWHKRRTSGVVVCRIGRFGVVRWCG